MKFLSGCVLCVFLPAAVFGQTAPRAEFEVASIKPSGPIVLGNRVNVGVHVDGSQVHCSFLSLKDYIRIAYRIKDHQVDGPDWIASERFEIDAKLPEGAKREQVPDMLKSLLVDRFQLKTHPDKKDFPVYGLVVAKNGSKLKEVALDADDGPAAVNVTASGGPGGTTVNYGRGSSFSMGDNKLVATKLTMASFADTLTRFMDRPVVDMTDLKGNYDFTMTFTPEDFRAMQIRSAIAAGINLPPEALRLLENTGDSLTSALAALGLKIESRKAPLEVVVVDHVEKAPTAN